MDSESAELDIGSDESLSLFANLTEPSTTTEVRPRKAQSSYLVGTKDVVVIVFIILLWIYSVRLMYR